MIENIFDAPIPGQSLTDTPGNAAWEHPPEFTDVEKAADYVWDILHKEDFLEQVISFLKGNRQTIGYVVGGFIAEKSHLDYGVESPTVFLSGLYKYYPDGRMKHQIRTVKNNKELDKIEFYGYPYDIQFLE